MFIIYHEHPNLNREKKTMTYFSEFFSTQVLQWLGFFSVMTFFASLLGVPWLILRMSPEYFIRHRIEVRKRHNRHPVLTVLLYCIRNVVGVLLLAAGSAMLILPGQGLLTLLIGLSVMDFPGKHYLLERCIKIDTIRHSLNWIRRKGEKEQFIFSADKRED